MAGATLAVQKQRASAVRPSAAGENGMLAFVQEGDQIDDAQGVEVEDGAAQRAQERDQLAQQYGRLDPKLCPRIAQWASLKAMAGSRTPFVESRKRSEYSDIN